jgi:hypothetical protein
MLTRRWVLGGLIAAPAVIAADKLMPIHVIPDRYATVWGVGWNFEVVEHVIWTPNDALRFARYNDLEKFREVTEVVYTNPPSPILRADHWVVKRVSPAKAFFDEERKKLRDDGCTYNHRVYGIIGECDDTTFIHKLNIVS